MSSREPRRRLGRYAFGPLKGRDIAGWRCAVFVNTRRSSCRRCRPTATRFRVRERRVVRGLSMASCVWGKGRLRVASTGGGKPIGETPEVAGPRRCVHAARPSCADHASESVWLFLRKRRRGASVVFFCCGEPWGGRATAYIGDVILRTAGGSTNCPSMRIRRRTSATERARPSRCSQRTPPTVAHVHAICGLVVLQTTCRAPSRGRPPQGDSLAARLIDLLDGEDRRASGRSTRPVQRRGWPRPPRAKRA